MRKSVYRQNAADYRSFAETARSEAHRSLLLTFASEWDALADAAAMRSKHHADLSAPEATVAEHPERLAD